jgi:hypothetical protein
MFDWRTVDLGNGFLLLYMLYKTAEDVELRMRLPVPP